jgi:tRNA threonylcarbamoyladenosine biosynthesis protein TsaB
LLLLAIDTTTKICSAALGDSNKILAEYTLNIKNTHSKHLMPLIVSLFKDAGVDKSLLEGVVVNVGPGSFTGIRIGMATAQGLCQGFNIPVLGVMNLDALAEACSFYNGLICPILDARREQTYTALYKNGPSGPVAVEEAAALSLEELTARLNRYDEEIIFLGDGIEVFREDLKTALGERYREMPYSSRFNRAALVLQKGIRAWQEEGPISPYALRPFYIRLPEAERKLREKTREEV